MLYKTYLMETPNMNLANTPARANVINTLAVVGFVALIVIGISLAVYSTRFVPEVVSRIGSAAVYLGSVFVPNNEPALTIVPPSTASTTIFFGSGSYTISTTTSAVATSTAIVPTPRPTPLPRPIGTTAGQNTSNTYQIGTTTANVTLYGLPDLITNIVAVGYLTSTSTDSFTASSTVPSGMRPAIKFTIRNVGTNVTGSWRFSVTIPTERSYFFQSPLQQSLAPGESIDYTLGFDQPTAGSGKMISITANFDKAVTESNPNNNSAAGYLTIMGS